MKPIKVARQKTGLTQLEVAKKLGITERAYQRIESGGSTPNVVIAKRIANILGAEIGELFKADVDEFECTSTSTKKLYDVEEFRTEVLNNRISKSTIYNKIKAGQIKAIHIGRKPFIPAWFVDKLLNSHDI
ncbi:MAG: XRE family transcriptional regulator [Smithella sp.]